MNTATTSKVPKPASVDPCAITAARLMTVCPLLRLDQAGEHARALEAARTAGDLITPARVRHFLAQAAHETQGFTRLRENFNYRDPARLDALFKAIRDIHHARALIHQGAEAIANCVYANRYGNGDPRSYDGWNFRGGGYLHVTFRGNYREVGDLVGLPLEKQPDLLGQPGPAALAAATYWKLRGINAEADRDDVKAVTMKINPALAGLDDRTAWVGRFRVVYP